MPVPRSRSLSQDGGGGGAGGGKGDGQGGKRSKSPATKSVLAKLWCAEFVKNGSCRGGDECPFPHLDQKGVDAMKKGLSNTKAKAKAKAAPAAAAS